MLCTAYAKILIIKVINISFIKSTLLILNLDFIDDLSFLGLYLTSEANLYGIICISI